MGVYIKDMEKPKDCWDCFNYNCGHWGTHGYDFAETDCPLIEINIVRCGECKHSSEYDMPQIDPKIEISCDVNLHSVSPNDFCSYGERRTDDSN